MFEFVSTIKALTVPRIMAKQTAILVIDIQEKLLPHMHNAGAIVHARIGCRLHRWRRQRPCACAGDGDGAVPQGATGVTVPEIAVAAGGGSGNSCVSRS